MLLTLAIGKLQVYCWPRNVTVLLALFFLDSDKRCVGIQKSDDNKVHALNALDIAMQCSKKTRWQAADDYNHKRLYLDLPHKDLRLDLD